MTPDEMRAQLRTDLIRTSVGTAETITWTKAPNDPSGPETLIDVTLPASRLTHFVELLGENADKVKVHLVLEPSKEIVEPMQTAPDLWKWATKRRRRQND